MTCVSGGCTVQPPGVFSCRRIGGGTDGSSGLYFGPSRRHDTPLLARD
jgi:hypothetical protein